MSDPSELKVELDGGKYTVVLGDHGAKFKAYRYREEWRDLTGDNLVMSLVHRVDELQTEVENQNALIDSIAEAANMAGYDCIASLITALRAGKVTA